MVADRAEEKGGYAAMPLVFRGMKPVIDDARL